MKEKTRAVHLQRCKDRAMIYVNAGDYQTAILSMLSDLTKHTDTVNSAKIGTMLARVELQNPTREGVTKFVQDFL